MLLLVKWPVCSSELDPECAWVDSGEFVGDSSVVEMLISFREW